MYLYLFSEARPCVCVCVFAFIPYFVCCKCVFVSVSMGTAAVRCAPILKADARRSVAKPT